MMRATRARVLHMSPTMAPRLTHRQRDAFQEICRFFAASGRLPTIHELALALGLQSPSTAYLHLSALKRTGLLRNGSRHIALTRPGLTALLAVLPALLDSRPERPGVPTTG